MQDHVSRILGIIQRWIGFATPLFGRIGFDQFVVEVLDLPGQTVGTDTVVTGAGAEGDKALVEVDVVPFDHHQPGHGLAGDRFALTFTPVLDFRLCHLRRSIVGQGYRNDIANRFRQVGLRHLTDFFRQVLEDVPVALRLPAGRNSFL